MARSPDILGELTAEHRAVTELLDRIGAAPPDGADRPDLVARLTDVLFSHCAAEEEYLFPAVQHDVTGGGALVFAAIHEHLAIGQYLADLQDLPPGDPVFTTLLGGLSDLVRRHLDTEEDRLYPAARRAVPAAARGELARQLRRERAENGG